MMISSSFETGHDNSKEKFGAQAMLCALSWAIAMVLPLSFALLSCFFVLLRCQLTRTLDDDSWKWKEMFVPWIPWIHFPHYSCF